MVISDVIMPEMDGYELCRKIKENENLKDIPVILLTTLSDTTDIIKGLECKANNFITKPYEEEFLIARIEYILMNMDIRKQINTEMGLEIYFAGHKHFLDNDRIQILDLLLSTYESAVQKSIQLEKANRELKEALETIKTLNGLIPICSLCKNMRNDSGYWQKVEEYIKEYSQAELRHAICPDCAKKHFPDYKV